MALEALALEILSQLPSTVSVNSATHAVTTHYNYALHQGQIYWRANPDYASSCNCTPRAPLEWQNLQVRSPRPTDNIGRFKSFVAISADDHEILAQTDHGQLWRSDHGQWSALWGMPLPFKYKNVGLQGHLKLPAYTHQIALSVRNKDVLFYEDPYGNQFHWGSSGCTTVMSLNQDGKTITIGDPWFPPDLSRQMCGPNRGSVRMISLYSSASMTMALAHDGTIYTRFYDYDSNGGTPFFNYQYYRVPKHTFPGSDRKSEFQIRGLPAEEWIKQPNIKLEGLAKISKHLAILQNGVGNNARELRVQGLNQNGETGYYFKQLKDLDWQFRVTNEKISEDNFLQSTSASIAPKDKSFIGQFIESNKKGRREVNRRETLLARIETEQMNIHCTPIRVKFKLTNGEQFEVLFHTVDAWTPFAEEDPEFNPFFVKRLKVTLELPKETLHHSSNVVQEFLEKHLKKDHLKTFRWAMVLDQERAQLRRVNYPFQLESETTEQFVMRFQNRSKIPQDYKIPIDEEELKRRLDFIYQIQGALPVPLVAADFLTHLTTIRHTVEAVKGLPSFEQHFASVLVANQMALEWQWKKMQKRLRVNQAEGK